MKRKNPWFHQQQMFQSFHVSKAQTCEVKNMQLSRAERVSAANNLAVMTSY